MTRVVNDTFAVMTRELMPTLRSPASLMFTLLQPLVFLALFGPLLAGSISEAALGGVDVWQWFVPGVLVMLAVFGSAGTGYTLQLELASGSFERTLVTPLSRSAIFAGKSLKEMVPLVLQALLILAVALPFGLRVQPLAALAGLAMLGVLGIGIGALSNALAISSRNSEWLFWSIQSTLQFPLLILSGMMLPLEAAPAWMRVASNFNPLRYVVDAQRALFAGDFGDAAVLKGIAAVLVTCAIGLVVGVRSIRRTGSR
jgi:ABC-2 type transport system permease protein